MEYKGSTHYTLVYWKSRRLRRYFNFALNASVNHLERELCMNKRGKPLSIHFPPWLPNEEKLESKLSSVKETISQEFGMLNKSK